MVTTNDKVTAAQYNSMRSSVNTVVATTYGQTMDSVIVTGGTGDPATSDTVEEVDMETLFHDIQKAYVHQNGVLDTTIEIVSAGNTIAADTSVNVNTATGAKIAVTGGTLMGYNDYIASITDISNHNGETDGFAASSFSLSAALTSTRTTSWGGAGQNQSVYHVFEVAFLNNNHRNFYFNAGGEIRFDASLTGTSGSKGTDWASLLSAMGTVKMDKWRTSAASGTPAAASGFDDLTNSYQTIFTKTGSGVYDDNDYTIEARRNGTNLRFRVTFNDGDVGTGGQGIGGVNDPIDESVTGTLTHNCTTFTPDSSYTYNSVVYPAVELAVPTKTTSTNLSQDLSTPPT
jgi:hypothetical protein